MTPRIPIMKTWKMLHGGKFMRSESERSREVVDRKGNSLGQVCLASRKDARKAVRSAHQASASWAGRSAYNRGQILYRMAEMLEGKGEEFATLLAATTSGGMRRAQKELAVSCDRLVSFAGWCDKYSQVLGNHNPVAGPFYNFTIPEPMGVVAIVAPEEEPLLGLISLLAPVLAVGNTAVALGSSAHPLATSLLGEVCETSDVPAGVVNLLTGDRDLVLPCFATHREIQGIAAAGCSSEETELLELGSCENLKRVRVFSDEGSDWYDHELCESPYRLEPFVEMKTIWHPSSLG